MIYTSYFANWRNFPKDSLLINITRFPPKNWKGVSLYSLAPSRKLLLNYKKGIIDENEFRNVYIQEIDKYRNKIIEYLRFLQNQNVILLCYEKKGDFCHRHIVAEWLTPDIEMREL